MEKPFPPRDAGPGLLPLPRSFRRPQSSLRSLQRPKREGAPGSPSAFNARRRVPSGWSGAGRLRPKPSRPRPLTLRPAPRPALAPPARPLQPQPRRRQSYLSLPSRESPGALQPPPPLRLYGFLPPRAPPTPTPHFLIRGPSQPCGLTQVPPPHGARAILGAALPASSLRPWAGPSSPLPRPCGPDS